MATLHIEHAITDLATWRGAFDKFADARAGAGVTATRIFQPVDDEAYIVVHLDFDSAEAAAQFRGFLEANVWSTPSNSPGLSGSPTARVLVAVD
jgi:hypothetical protein